MAAVRLAAIVDSSDDAIVSKDLDGTILTWNKGAERLFGFTAAEVVGGSIKTIIPQELWAEEDRILARIRAGQRVDHYETKRRRKDGELLDMSLTVSPIRDAEGRVVGASKIGRDVTERNRVERELRRLNEELEERVRARTHELELAVRELDAFNYTVSHDLRTPLRAIRGFAALLADTVAGEEDRRHVQYIQEGASEMSRIVEALLRLSRIKAATLARQDVDVSAVARRVADGLARNDPQRRVDVTIEPGLRAQADEALLAVALENLVGNAWKFTAKNRQGHIRVGRRTHAGREAFFVEDDGIGLSSEDVEQLFQPFQRLHPAEFEGHGIGLATVRRILHAHGGGLDADGEPGRRATFYFWL